MYAKQIYSYSFSNYCKQIAFGCLVVLTTIGCTNDYPASVGNPIPAVSVVQPPASTSACSCSTTTVGSTTVSPVSATMVTAATPDTLLVLPPRFSPDGGNFYFSTTVNLVADTLPNQAVFEYSLDNGQSWQTGQQVTLTAGASVLSRFRVGNRVSRSRAAAFSIYYKRMLVIGNSIMGHGPAPDLGWTNSNGMAASAPEKDFVHLLTARLQALYPALTVTLQSGGNFEFDFGKATYSINEFDEPLQKAKPDLIVLRIGENMDDNAVLTRNLDSQLRQLLTKLATYGQPVKIVVTTSVWYRPQADEVIRRVVASTDNTLVDLSCMVGQPQYFASQYANPAVAAHPNDVGMQRIADLIWAKIQ